MEHNEILKYAKVLYEYHQTSDELKNELVNAFPELRKNDDEKIKQELISLVRLDGWHPTIWTQERKDKLIDWLEKQSKNSQAMCPTFTYDDILALQCCMETAKKVQEDKELYEQLQSLHDRLHDAYWLKKQDNQKPQDKSVIEAIKEEKVEQKFQIIKNTWYICTCTTFSEDSRIWFKKGIAYLGNDILKYDLGFEPNDYQNYFRLWSIEDAKPGDILDANGAPFIYKKHDKNYVYFYCGVNLAGDFIVAHGIDAWNGNNKVYPITKEQSEFFFQKMKENGYTWDPQKKELKEIDSFCRENCKGFQETGKCFADGDCEAKIDAEKKELKKCVIDEGKAEMDYCFTKMMNGEKVSTAWSAEDEFKVQRICKYLNEAKKYYADITEVRDCIDWLKFIQNKISTQNIKSPLWKKVDQPIYINTKDIALVQKKDQSDSFKGCLLYLDHTLDPKVDERYILLKDLL